LHKLTKVDGASHEISFEGKESIPYDLLVAIQPHRSPKVVHDSGLTNAAGWIPVDRYTLKTEIENIYALGDVTAVSLPGRWKPDVPLMLPKAGVFAHAQAEVVARRIAAEIDGTNPEDKFAGSGYCMLEAGEGMAGFAYGNFFAEPAPQLNLHRTGRKWHLGKVLFEQWWLSPQGAKRETLHLALTLGAKIQGIKALV
jgi:sulfide:quinone oxidoreductase